MKNILKILTGVALSIVIFSSCNVENKKETYTPINDCEVTFTQATISATEILADQTSFNIDITRNTATSALTIPVKATLKGNITCPESVTFEAGSYATVLTIDISQLPIGTQASGSIELTDPTTFNANLAITKTSFTLAKAYTWLKYGVCKYTDDLVTALFSVENQTYDVTVEKADGFDVFKVIDIYGANYPYNAPGEYTPGASIIIDCSVADKVVIAKQNLGFDWGYGEFYIGTLEYGAYANKIVTFPKDGLAVGMGTSYGPYAANNSGLFKLDLSNPK